MTDSFVVRAFSFFSFFVSFTNLVQMDLPFQCKSTMIRIANVNLKIKLWSDKQAYVTKELEIFGVVLEVLDPEG
jgi:hypothetical protein